MVSKTFMSQARRTRFLVEYEVTHEGAVRRDGNVLENRIRAGRNYVKMAKFMRVDELVLNAFRPNPAPFFYTCVDHLNRDLTDDRLCNLRWSNATLRKFNMTATPYPGSDKMRYLRHVRGGAHRVHAQARPADQGIRCRGDGHGAPYQPGTNDSAHVIERRL